MTAAKPQAPTDEDGAMVPELARYSQRFLALLADWILCMCIAGGLVRLGVLPELDFSTPAWVPVAGWPSAIFVIEYTLFLGLFAQTPGMRLLKIYCVSAVEGNPIGIPRAFARGVLTALVLPILTAFSDPYRRGLHDKLTGSAVVR
ncbi:MAG TPA: RDD family protein [Candidatus Stackebrandtia faecavium]|nr:RDD family protein [Candidatus Stackebrandtia faecavium]